ncbi:MAG TPA: TraB/GumN family protein, partial [Polyangiaceae bacterium]
MTRLQRFLIFVFLLVGCGSSKERVDTPQPQPSANASASTVASAEPSATASASAAQVTQPPPAIVWKPFLYKIAGTKPSYLFGTIHVPDDRLAMPAQSLKDAFHDAEEVVTELPLDDTSPAHAMQLAGMPNGKTLTSELPKPVYARLKKVLDDKGLGMAMPMMEKMKVWAVAIQIGLLDHLQELMGGKKPIDVVLHDRAKELGKKTSGLETEAEQLTVFDTLSKD